MEKKFDNMISHFEITYEFFSFHIFEQNEHFERKIFFIAIKTPIFRIHVNFSTYL